jgi:(p)ppGpp synthase/HD superfamily hydrolase
MNDLVLARVIAEKAHAGQKYGEEAYTFHLSDVEEQCRAMYGDERTRIVAQLHDVLEDTLMTEATLSALFDDDIVKAVVAITKLKHETRENYLNRCKENELARKVKLADSFCNLKNSLLRYDAGRIARYGKQIAYLVQ